MSFLQASLSCILGLIFAVIAWLVTAKKECGDLSVACPGSNNPMLAGNVVALLSPLVLIPIFPAIFGIVRFPPPAVVSWRNVTNKATGQIRLEVYDGHPERRRS